MQHLFSGLRTLVHPNLAAGAHVEIYTSVVAVAGTVGWGAVNMARDGFADLSALDAAAGGESGEMESCDLPKPKPHSAVNGPSI